METFLILQNYLFPRQLTFFDRPFSTVSINWRFTSLFPQSTYIDTEFKFDTWLMRRRHRNVTGFLRRYYKLFPWLPPSVQMVTIDTLLSYMQRDYELGISYRPEGWQSAYNLLHSFGCINVRDDLFRIYMFESKSLRLAEAENIKLHRETWLRKYSAKHRGCTGVSDLLDKATTLPRYNILPRRSEL